MADHNWIWASVLLSVPHDQGMDSKGISLEWAQHRLIRYLCYKCQIGLLGKKIRCDSAFFYYWCCMPRRSDINERRWLSSPEETSTFTGAILVQRRALEWRRGPHIPFLDKVSPISTQFSKSWVMVMPEYHPERTVRLRLFVLNAYGSSMVSVGT